MTKFKELNVQQYESWFTNEEEEKPEGKLWVKLLFFLYKNHISYHSQYFHYYLSTSSSPHLQERSHIRFLVSDAQKEIIIITTKKKKLFTSLSNSWAFVLNHLNSLITQWKYLWTLYIPNLCKALTPVWSRACARCLVCFHLFLVPEVIHHVHRWGGG